MNQDELLRKRTIQYQEEHGTRSCFICENTDIEPAFFCRWRKGQKKLNEESYSKLNQFLASKGY